MTVHSKLFYNPISHLEIPPGLATLIRLVLPIVGKNDIGTPKMLNNYCSIKLFISPNCNIGLFSIALNILCHIFLSFIFPFYWHRCSNCRSFSFLKVIMKSKEKIETSCCNSWKSKYYTENNREKNCNELMYKTSLAKR